MIMVAVVLIKGSILIEESGEEDSILGPRAGKKVNAQKRSALCYCTRT